MPIVSGDKAKEIEKLLKIKLTPEVEKGIKILENMFENSDVELVRHGEWREEFRSQKSPDGYFYWNAPQKKIYVCSICGREEIKKEPYCHCGAKMDGGKYNGIV